MNKIKLTREQSLVIGQKIDALVALNAAYLLIDNLSDKTKEQCAAMDAIDEAMVIAQNNYVDCFEVEE